MGRNHIHLTTSRNAVRGLDAACAHMVAKGHESRAFETKGQWLPRHVEPPVYVPDLHRITPGRSG